MKQLFITRALLTILVVTPLLVATAPIAVVAQWPDRGAPASTSLTVVRRRLPSTPHPTSQGAGLMLVENVGQWDTQVRFQVWGGPGMTWVGDDGSIWITLLDATDRDKGRPGKVPPSRALVKEETPQRAQHIRLTFLGANPTPRMEPYGPLETVVSYLIGGDRDAWHTNVPVWSGVRCGDLYPGIDLIIGKAGVGSLPTSGTLRWLLVASANSALDDVRLRVEGAEIISLTGMAPDAKGRAQGLRLGTPLGEIDLPLLGLAWRGEGQGPSLNRVPLPLLEGDVVRQPFAYDLSAPSLSGSCPYDLLMATTWRACGKEAPGRCHAIAATRL